MQINVRGNGLIKPAAKCFALNAWRSCCSTFLLLISVWNKRTWGHLAYLDCRKFNFPLVCELLELSIPTTHRSTGGANSRENSCNQESLLYLGPQFNNKLQEQLPVLPTTPNHWLRGGAQEHFSCVFSWCIRVARNLLQSSVSSGWLSPCSTFLPICYLQDS